MTCCHLYVFVGPGAHAEDWEKWRSLLYGMYSALEGEISHIGSRGKYATGSRNIAVKENLIELTADICHQVTNYLPLLDQFQSITHQQMYVNIVPH